MIAISELKSLINALRSETQLNSISPDSLGAILQKIIDFVDSQTAISPISRIAALPTTSQLPQNPSNEQQRTIYLISGYLYAYMDNRWQDVGTIQGPQGLKGDKGNDGVLLDSEAMSLIDKYADSNETSTEANRHNQIPSALAVEENHNLIFKQTLKRGERLGYVNSSVNSGATLKDGTLEAVSSSGSYRKWVAIKLPDTVKAGDIIRIETRNAGGISVDHRAAFFAKEEGTNVAIGDAYIADSLFVRNAPASDTAWHVYYVPVPEGATHICLGNYYKSTSLPSYTYAYMTEAVQTRISDLESEVEEDIALGRDMSANSDLSISDENGYEIVRFLEGHIKTKNFDSRSVGTTFKPYQHETLFTYSVEGTPPMEAYEEGVDSFSTIANSKAVTKSKSYTDRAALYLPLSYDPLGKPTRMVMFGRQGGGTFNSSNNFVKADITSNGTNYLNIVPFLLFLGYAVLAVDGTPDAWASELKLEDGYVNGNYIAVRSAKTIYDKVIQEYNICRDGVYGYGYSQGGWMIWNIAELSGIPFLGLMLKSPVVYLGSYFNVTFDELGNVTSRTVTINGVEYPRWRYFMVKQYYGIDTTGMTQEQFLAIPREPWRWAGYDPFLRYASDVATDEEVAAITANNTSEDLAAITMKRLCRFPVKIWIAKNDSDVGFKRQATIIKAIRNAGGWADIRMYARGDHWMSPSNWTPLGTFIYREKTYSLYPPTYEMALFLRKFGGLPVTFSESGSAETEDEGNEGA